MKIALFAASMAAGTQATYTQQDQDYFADFLSQQIAEGAMSD